MNVTTIFSVQWNWFPLVTTVSWNKGSQIKQIPEQGLVWNRLTPKILLHSNLYLNMSPFKLPCLCWWVPVWDPGKPRYPSLIPYPPSSSLALVEEKKLKTKSWQQLLLLPTPSVSALSSSSPSTSLLDLDSFNLPRNGLLREDKQTL